MKVNTKGLAIATAALLIAGCASDDKDKTADNGMDKMGQCHGANSCKGKSVCATADSSCMGQNSCKGKGWIKTSKTDCDAIGGKFVMK